jgi:asparaginyl-tRNA synthetase
MEETESLERAATPRPLEQLESGELQRRRDIAAVTTRVLRELSGSFISEGFDWLLPVILSKSTDPLWPDPGASIEKRLEMEVYGEPVRATMSMIVHKMVACSLLVPRLFVVSPNIRLEKRERSATGRHAYEFNQFDFEIRDASAGEVRALVERVLVGLSYTLRVDMAETLSGLGGLGRTMIPRMRFPVLQREELEET